TELQDLGAPRSKDGVWLTKDQMAALMELFSYFIILKNSFQMIVESKDTMSLQKIHEKQGTISHSLNVLSDQFQGILDKAQKTPLKEAFSGLFPLVRQAAYELKKDVRFVDTGFDLEVDKVLATDLYKALMHMVRNSMDHGFETPELRTQAGKNPQGLLQIKI